MAREQSCPRHVGSGSFKLCPSRANLASLSLRVIERDAEFRKSQDEAGGEMLGRSRTRLLTEVRGRLTHRNLPGGSCIGILRNREYSARKRPRLIEMLSSRQSPIKKNITTFPGFENVK
jgi:hypothetical protein